MFIPMKRKEVLRDLTSTGYRLVRSTGSHDIYSNGIEKLTVPRTNTISSGVVNKLYKQMKKAS